MRTRFVVAITVVSVALSSGLVANAQGSEIAAGAVASMVEGPAAGDLQTARRITSPPPTPGSPPPTDAVTFEGSTIPLTHGFEEAFSYRPTQRGDTHSASQLQVADDEFTPLVITSPITGALTIWRPVDATVWLRADLRSPGGDGIQSATFEYEPDSVDENGPGVAGRHFFNEARFGVDLNGDADIDSDDDEFLDVVGGTIELEWLGGREARFTFDLQIEGGRTAVGSFEGSFPLFDNDPTP